MAVKVATQGLGGINVASAKPRALAAGSAQTSGTHAGSLVDSAKERHVGSSACGIDTTSRRTAVLGNLTDSRPRREPKTLKLRAKLTPATPTRGPRWVLPEPAELRDAACTGSAAAEAAQHALHAFCIHLHSSVWLS
jgi:hypothetical protein